MLINRFRAQKYYTKICLYILLFALMGVLLSGQILAADKPKIGLSLADLGPWYVEFKRGFEEICTNNGYEVITLTPAKGHDIVEQVNQIEDLIEKGVVAVGCVPGDADGMVPAVEACNKANIPFIAGGAGVNGGILAADVRADTYKAAFTTGEYIAAKIGYKGNVVIIEGVPGIQSNTDRMAGFNAALAQYPEIKVLAQKPGYWERSQSFTVMEDMLIAFPKIDAVFASADASALGALEAINSAGRREEILLVGYDCVPEALESIKNGGLDASLDQIPAEIGRTAAKETIASLKEGYTRRIILMQLFVIDRDNLKEFHPEVFD